MDHALGAGRVARSVAHVRARIARCILPSLETCAPTVGDVTLMPHQREAVVLVRQCLARFGGALLADPVGTGKTWVALAVAAAGDRVTVVAPAALRSMWTRALAQAAVSAPVLSFETLSRRPTMPFEGNGLLIVDEAHHARNPTTRRYGALARLAWGQDVLLLSASPIHNRARDLHALCALFLGQAASRAAPDMLARLVCRRLDALPTSLPRVAPPRWITLPQRADVLASLLTLPPPVPPGDGGVAAALGMLVLLRQWCSSDAALLAAIERRLTTGVAMESQLIRGLHVTRADLRRWIVDTGVIQLDLPLARDRNDAVPAGLHEHLLEHVAALRVLRDLVRARGAPDADRLTRLSAILRDSLPARSVLFTHSVDTARTVYRALAPRFRCALLAGSTTRVATGRVTRDEVVQRFAPDGAGPPRAANRAMRMDVLIATDVLSEGVDLHDASVLVHLDLPWTMARLEQRIGRLRRLGATHAHVAQYAFTPPGGIERVLRLVQRLGRKAGIARQEMGMDPLAFTLPVPAPTRPSRFPRDTPADAVAALRQRARAWSALAADGHDVSGDLVEVAIAWSLSRERGMVAVVDPGDGPLVVATSPSGLDASATAVEAACARCAPDHPAHDAAIPRRQLDDAMRRVQGWCAAEGTRLALLGDTNSDVHRRVLRRLGAMRRDLGGRGQRQVAGELALVRDAVLRSRGAGAERFLESWLGTMAQVRLTAEHVTALRHALEPRTREARRLVAPRVACVLLLVPRP